MNRLLRSCAHLCFPPNETLFPFLTLHSAADTSHFLKLLNERLTAVSPDFTPGTFG